MKTIGNTLVERRIARWGHRAGLACSARRGDEGCGKVSVWEDNHGLRGWPSLTLGSPEERQALMHRRSSASEGTFGNAEPEGCASMCAQSISVIRGYLKDGLQRLDRPWVKEEGFQPHRGFLNCTFRKVDILMMLKADDVGASTLGEHEKRQALAQPIRVIRGSFQNHAAINAAA